MSHILGEGGEYAVHFGALYRKELPQEQYEQMRLELFKAILTYAQGPRIVRSKLCVTVTEMFIICMYVHKCQREHGQ